MFYSSTIFTQVGFTPKYGTAIVGFVNMVSTFGSVPLLKCKTIACFNSVYFSVWKENNIVGFEFCNGS